MGHSLLALNSYGLLSLCPATTARLQAVDAALIYGSPYQETAMKRTSNPGKASSHPERQPEEASEQSSAAAESSPAEAIHAVAGNQAVKELHENGELQPKLAVSQPADPQEREAERVAERVLRMDEQVDSEQEPVVSRRATGGDGGTVDSETETQLRSVTSGGRQLDGPVRSYFEPRFGRDFSDVRVHTGPAADEAAQSINAEAFTMGTDIVFADGKYQPGSNSGKELLAHELAHVAQQTSGVGRQVVQRQTALPFYDVIKQKLTRGLTDWAITDENAAYVLERLQGMSDSDLELTIHQLERDNLFQPLLDNISEATYDENWEFVHRIQIVSDREVETLSDESMEMLEELDEFLSNQAPVFINLVGASPWVDLALSNPLETLAGMVGLGSLSPMPAKYKEAVEASKEIVGHEVSDRIARFYLNHQASLSHTEVQFWRQMEAMWSP